MTDDDTNPANAPCTFPQVLDTLRFGILSEELTAQLSTLTQKCAATGRAGTLTLKLQLKPGKGGQIEIFDELAVKEPKQERGSTLMFSTPDGALTRNDPRQINLPLRAVDKATGEIRMVAKG
jgi:hypothetical protein